MTTIEEIRQILKETAKAQAKLEKAQVRLMDTQERQAKEYEKRWKEQEKRQLAEEKRRVAKEKKREEEEEKKRLAEEKRWKEEEKRRREEEKKRLAEEKRWKEEEKKRLAEEKRREEQEEKRWKERGKEREIAKQRLHRLERIQEIASKKSEQHLEQLKRRMNQFVGGWDNRWGRFIECLVKWSVVRLLKIRGIIIDRVRQRVTDKTSPQSRWEIDVLAENSKLMVAIEAKHYLTKSDVDEAIERFKKFKQDYKDGSGKVLYGGVGYLDCEEKIDKYAERRGLFVFRSIGDSAVITNEENFKPKAL